MFLSNITLYPIKSLAGISVNQWEVSQTGLLYDRKFLLIDEKGHFLSQRTLPQMALLSTAIEDNTLIITSPTSGQFSIPLNPQEGELTETVIWHDTCIAKQISQDANKWFSSALRYPCQLVYAPDTMNRLVDTHYGKPTDYVNFTDGFPFLIVSENSLHELNKAMGLTMSMARFRPNLVISNCEGFAEDYWREIQIGNIDFRLPKPCSRCVIPTIDPETAEIGKEPLATLNRLRKWQNKVYFGQNALHNQQGILSVGDNVIIKTTGSMQPPLDAKQ